MKIFMLACWFCLPLATIAQGSDIPAARNASKIKVPEGLITGDSISWMISTVSTMGYVNTTPGANYNTYKSGGGMIVRFKFSKDGTYRFQMYLQANSYGVDTETWTDCEGTVEFFRNSKGHQFMRTRALKGTYRIARNGNTTTRPVPASDLANQHSNTYICELTLLKDDPVNEYFLLVDLDAHPTASLDNPATIQPDWVSRFHIPKRK